MARPKSVMLRDGGIPDDTDRWDTPDGDPDGAEREAFVDSCHQQQSAQRRLHHAYAWCERLNLLMFRGATVPVSERVTAERELEAARANVTNHKG